MDLRTLIPEWEIRKDKIAKVRKATQEALHNIYTKETGNSHPVIRDLTASDLGLSCWITPAQKQGEWSSWVDIEVTGLRYIAIYKVTQITQNPKVHTMKLTVSYATKGIFDLDAMYGVLPVLHKLNELKDEGWLELTFAELEEIRMEAYFPTVYVIPQRARFSVEILSSFDNEGDWLVLGGYVIEPEGMRIIA